MGTGRFTGPRLRDLLQRAAVKSPGKHVMFRGLDEVPGNEIATRRAVEKTLREKSESRLFHLAWKSRKLRGIPTLPQPRRLLVFLKASGCELLSA